MKKQVVVLSFVLILSVGLVSAGWFDWLFGKDVKLSPSDDMISYYDFNTNYEDGVGQRHGTNNGVELRDSDIGLGKYVYFNGENYVDFGDYYHFPYTRAFSYGFLIKYEEDGMVFSKFDSEVIGQWYVQIVNDKVEFHREISPYNLRGSNSLDNNWHHVIVTYDGSVMKIYVDGVLDNSMNSGYIESVSVDVLLGAQFSDNVLGNFFEGGIDELKVWDMALSDSEVGQEYGSYDLVSDICTDTDVANDVLIAGTCTDDTSGSPYVDECINEQLVQYECDNDVCVALNAVDCGAGFVCDAGTCSDSIEVDGCNYLDNRIRYDIWNLENSGKDVVKEEGGAIYENDYFVVNANTSVDSDGDGTIDEVFEGSILLVDSISDSEIELTQQISDVNYIVSLTGNVGTLIIDAGTDNEIEFEVTYYDDIEDYITIDFSETNEFEILNFSGCDAECNINEDCGTDGNVGDGFCHSDDYHIVYQNHTTFSCDLGICSSEISKVELSDCGDEVCVEVDGGSDECAVGNNPLIEYTLDLDEGWNLISIPLFLLDGNVSVVFESIEDEVISVWGYDAVNDGWESWTSGDAADDLNEIKAGKGYWVRMNSAQSIVLNGTYFRLGSGGSPDTIPVFHVYDGWNLISVHLDKDTTSMSIEDYFANLYLQGDTWMATSLWKWDIPTGQSSKNYIKLLISDNPELEKGKGYWLYSYGDNNIVI